MMSSMLWALTIVMTFFLNPQAEASQGPGSTKKARYRCSQDVQR